MSLLLKNVFNLLRERLVSSAAGHMHSLAVTENGKVFEWGTNNHSELGIAGTLANKRDEYNSPMLVAFGCECVQRGSFGLGQLCGDRG